MRFLYHKNKCLTVSGKGNDYFIIFLTVFHLTYRAKICLMTDETLKQHYKNHEKDPFDSSCTGSLLIGSACTARQGRIRTDATD